MICKILIRPPVWLVFYRPECKFGLNDVMADFGLVIWLKFLPKGWFVEQNWLVVKKFGYMGLWYFAYRYVKYTLTPTELEIYYTKVLPSDRYWPYEIVCRISVRPCSWFIFYRSVSTPQKYMSSGIASRNLSKKVMPKFLPKMLIHISFWYTLEKLPKMYL